MWCQLTNKLFISQHPNASQSAPNPNEESAASANQSNQPVSPQPNAATPAPVSNSADQQLQTQTSTDDEPLPSGWEVIERFYKFWRSFQELLKWFFIETNTTLIFQVRFDQFGRRYYVDHNTRSTWVLTSSYIANCFINKSISSIQMSRYWEKPSPLPPGWEVYNLFYHYCIWEARSFSSSIALNPFYVVFSFTTQVNKIQLFISNNRFVVINAVVFITSVSMKRNSIW